MSKSLIIAFSWSDASRLSSIYRPFDCRASTRSCKNPLPPPLGDRYFPSGDQMKATLQDLTQDAGRISPDVWAVDLDGTLVRTDTLWESVVAAAMRQPLQFVAALLALRHGRQHFKRQIAEITVPDPETLPFRAELLRLIRQHRDSGGQLHLVTAAHQSIADAVAAHLGVFASATGSTAQRNLKGITKAAFLAERFPDGFAYIGDSRADLPVWRRAQGALLVGCTEQLVLAVEAAGIPILANVPDRRPQARDYAKLLRVHQWEKNILILVPLLLGHALGKPDAWLRVAMAFVAFCMVASSTYIFNDLADLAADRQHPTKRSRPVAGGDISVPQAMAIAVGLFSLGMSGSFLISHAFSLCISAYVVLTVLYSWALKRIALIDAAIIGALSVLRIIIGMCVAPVPYSDWLVSFSILFFCSLAFAKRHSELIEATAAGVTRLPGRGYRPGEWPLTLAFGVSMAIASLIVMLLYIRLGAMQGGLHSRAGWLIVAPLATLCWIMRLWLVSHRGELDDDPIVFALRDRVSWGLAAVVAAGVICATS